MAACKEQSCSPWTDCGKQFPQTLPGKKTQSARTKTLVFVILTVTYKENTHIWFSDSWTKPLACITLMVIILLWRTSGLVTSGSEVHPHFKGNQVNACNSLECLLCTRQALVPPRDLTFPLVFLSFFLSFFFLIQTVPQHLLSSGNNIRVSRTIWIHVLELHL